MENNYVYPPDPVNGWDLSGERAQRGRQKNRPKASREQERAAEEKARGKGDYDKRAYKQWRQTKKAQEKYDRERRHRETKAITRVVIPIVVVVWWGAKALSPACGPLAPACAYAL